ncbi:hypothetical protein Kpol_1064p50 [Vanderwaltozyma polyspora DSM 70294]|uniref:rRNA biogenesis protein RRP36 n=1 Tax=Vanderwaltozyma polyspora (strain ATCC 22028 / DSM 70294 / BCRC 21397 / CBS 2163 / NBRC 10782 / NRRL Y-8283 / UCD 57-17) TaxID=436907 RepID=RRP36_VANPO|nr:uncharacterized protein Kpol_1064p50 [Vanderwaltozyma polyspora DSM 70294]A7TMH4.1 RecName: Full=rRNA biogenesis protein RRP36; AltName: Full=Ribosomal RNA-processing protein 36 [Vanderwaltozyma polyspora DSM 70294]EDO16568.1 hypothetical protein Kpol_1064p50 [Vanderwaltozyma polyspora DSM 70294]
MSYYFKNLKPGQESDSEEDDLGKVLARNTQQEDESTDDELKTLSFGSLKKADAILEDEDSEDSEEEADKKMVNERKRKQVQEELKVSKKRYVEEEFEDDSSDSDSDSGSDNEGGFFEEDSGDEIGVKSKKKNKSRHKHAPTEHSSKKRVSKIRKIPGLETSRPKSNLYTDIRFDKSTGDDIDVNSIRKRYAFLDEYRQKEIDELEGMLKDRKFVNKLGDREYEDMQGNLKSMKSRLQTVKNRDLESKVIKEYEEKINMGNKNRYHLKESEKRKVLQKWKFDHMKAKQREKVMERKRKKKLGKEFKQFEFHKQR